MKTAFVNLFILCWALPSLASPEQLVPNFYTCTGDGIKATYSYVSVPGQALLAISSVDNNSPIQHSNFSLQFGTPIGTLISLPLDTLPDLYETEYVWVIPPINLAPNNYYEGGVQFKTVLFLQKSYTTIGGPGYVIGPQKEILETYHVSCIADYTN